MRYLRWTAVLSLVFGLGMVVGASPNSQDGDDMAHQGLTYKSTTSGTTLRMLLDEDNLGGAEVEIGEITFPPGADSGDHPHGSTEIFYVLSGELEHIVNGKSYVLKPGMLGFVRPPDRVNHRVGSNGPAKALVIWAPGGEAGRIVGNWERQ